MSIQLHEVAVDLILIWQTGNWDPGVKSDLYNVTEANRD